MKISKVTVDSSQLFEQAVRGGNLACPSIALPRRLGIPPVIPQKPADLAVGAGLGLKIVDLGSQVQTELHQRQRPIAIALLGQCPTLIEKCGRFVPCQLPLIANLDASLEFLQCGRGIAERVSYSPHAPVAPRHAFVIRGEFKRL